MAITVKPISYTVDTGHAKCPDHLYMLDDSTGGTTVADGVGSLDLTATATSMWDTDATYGQILRFVAASSQKALSGNTFAATSGICMVFLAKSGTTAANKTIGGVGHSSTANTYASARLTITSGTLNGIARYAGGTTWNSILTGNVTDDTWRVFAVKFSDTTGADGQAFSSADGSAWGNCTETTTSDVDLAGFNRFALGCLATPSPSSFLDGDILAAYVYKDDYSAWDDAWIASIYADPWQFLDVATGHPAQSRSRGIPGMNTIASRFGRGW